MRKNLTEALKDVRDLSRADFLTCYLHPTFLVRPHTQLTDTTLLRTLSPQAGGDYAGYSLAPIVKRRGASGFPTVVTIGRAESNDLRISAPGVSKYHALVRIDQSPLQLMDGGSSYGTSHNGRRLKPKGEPARLMSGDDVILGDTVGMTFLNPEALYDQLRGLLKDSDTPTRPQPV